MVHLNLFHKLLLASTLFLPLKAGVVEFFNPNNVNHSSDFYINSGLLMASDPISLDGMFHDWDGEYHPKEKENLAMQDMRLDIGTTIFGKYYLGYFYRHNVAIKAGKDFTDFFYRTKNHIDLDPNRVYELNLDIEGIEQSGLLLSRAYTIVENDEESIKIGGAISLTTGHDMQQGHIRGQAKVLNKKSYHASGEISSYYTHNYLYDLEVNKASAYGYGSDIALAYINKKHDVNINFIVNDIFSTMYWKDLPYSDIDIETNNDSYDEDGYVHYSPSISGDEFYRDFKQTIDPRYRLEVSKGMNNGINTLVSIDYLYDEVFPYVEVSKTLSPTQDLALSYESKFGSFGLDYQHNNFSIGVRSDGLKDASTIGLHSRLFLNF